MEHTATFISAKRTAVELEMVEVRKLKTDFCALKDSCESKKGNVMQLL